MLMVNGEKNALMLLCQKTQILTTSDKIEQKILFPAAWKSQKERSDWNFF